MQKRKQTRKRIEIENKIKEEIKKIYNENTEKLNYIYYECFDKKENNKDEIYKKINEELENNFNEIEEKLLPILKLTKNIV